MKYRILERADGMFVAQVWFIHWHYIDGHGGCFISTESCISSGCLLPTKEEAMQLIKRHREDIKNEKEAEKQKQQCKKIIRMWSVK